MFCLCSLVLNEMKILAIKQDMKTIKFEDRGFKRYLSKLDVCER